MQAFLVVLVIWAAFHGMLMYQLGINSAQKVLLEMASRNSTEILDHTIAVDDEISELYAHVRFMRLVDRLRKRVSA